MPGREDTKVVVELGMKIFSECSIAVITGESLSVQSQEPEKPREGCSTRGKR